jgi:hypothetical protein
MPEDLEIKYDSPPTLEDQFMMAALTGLLSRHDRAVSEPQSNIELISLAYEIAQLAVSYRFERLTNTLSRDK